MPFFLPGKLQNLRSLEGEEKISPMTFCLEETFPSGKVRE